MIIFPKRVNVKTHQQNGVDISNNTTKKKKSLFRNILVIKSSFKKK